MGFAVFLDRDGVINIDSPDYIKSENEFHFIPGSTDAIALLTEAGCDVFVITNQSAVGRGMITKGELDIIFAKMKEGVTRAGGRINDIFYCPHTPDDACLCRKPLPGMIFQAVEKHGINLSFSVMVGDSVKDIECARKAGCAAAVLVLTGNGQKSMTALEKKGTPPDMMAADLMEAAQWIIAHLPDLSNMSYQSCVSDEFTMSEQFNVSNQLSASKRSNPSCLSKVPDISKLSGQDFQSR
ncbi:Histidinol-phosphate phosphatase family protein [Desulfamplus magnetovallimortis]|uniref:D,D-heptose 1,7-bisphosphate phosphatase n=1 Tax=Desulfamplus magnetovallimortis TaxID=1246637 RepID=A0A1W1HJF2_9BACT|nr:Histidinol-phosphate phosphatase family protein [Desulfamplus magnetovallimortis]